MKTKPKRSVQVLLVLLSVFLAAPGLAQDVNPREEDIPEAPAIYSPYVERTANDNNFAEGLYWGDTHLHTGYSTDAGMIGNTLGPEEAYRFAMGQEVISSTGQRARLIRALDFLVVSDHAENLGLAPMIDESNADLLKSENGRRLHDLVKAGDGYEAFRVWAGSVYTGDLIQSPKMQEGVLSLVGI